MYFRKVKEDNTTKDILHLLYGCITGVLADTMGRVVDGTKYFVEGYYSPSIGGISIYIKNPHWETRTYQDGFATSVLLMGLLYSGVRLGYYGYKIYKYNKRN